MCGRKNGMVWTFLGVLAIKQGQLAPGLPFCTGTAIVCGALAMPRFADDGHVLLYGLVVTNKGYFSRNMHSV